MFIKQAPMNFASISDIDKAKLEAILLLQTFCAHPISQYAWTHFRGKLYHTGDLIVMMFLQSQLKLN